MESQKTGNREKFVEGVDYFYENAFMVLTKFFLKKRGYCCKNGCRHCPYLKEQNKQSQKKCF